MKHMNAPAIKDKNVLDATMNAVIAFQLWLQVMGAAIPSDLLVMMPYILTIVALVLMTQRVRAPSALTKPFEREG